VDRSLHFGHRTTSRVEGAHNTLKTYLQVSTGDLRVVYDKITLLLANQLAQYEAGVAQNKTRTPHTSRDPFYAALIGRVSNFALGQIWKQRHRLAMPETLSPCIGTFTASMGLPCTHIIQIHLHENGMLHLDDVHPHWHFETFTPLLAQPLVLEPAITQTRGRPANQDPPAQRRPNRTALSRRAASSTRRNPSAFERIDMPVRARTRSARGPRHVAFNDDE
jgi:hypothetical protein